MKFESNIDQRAEHKLNEAKQFAPPESIKNFFFKQEAEIAANFIQERFSLEQFKDALEKLGETEGVAKFDTLPEFIAAVRQLNMSRENQNVILDHENAHALEAIDRGYSFSYEIHFTKDVKHYFILLVTKLKPVAAAIKLDYFHKQDSAQSEDELRTDLIAIITAPEHLTDGQMSELDKLALGR